MIIEKIDNSTAIEWSERNRIKAEAIFVRSLLYFYLQQIFNEIPYTTSTDYEANSILGKIKKEELLSKIENDLQLAVSLLNDDYRSSDKIYPNKKVAQLLLAKVFLLESKWNDAEILGKNIIQSPLYSFETDLEKVFKKEGSHILWQLKPQNEGESTQEASFFYFENSAPNTYSVSDGLFNTFDTDDWRKNLWVTPVTSSGQTWYRYSKYKSLLDNQDEYSVIMRLEEVYFTLGESLAMQGKITEAVPYLNFTRVRAGLQPLAGITTKEQFLEELLKEKRKEFFAEFGMRFFDLKRLNRLNDLVITKPNWMHFHEALPIPQKELILNPNLAPQNTGY